MANSNVCITRSAKMAVKNSILLTLAVVGKGTIFTEQFLKAGRSVRLRDARLTQSGCRIRIWLLEWEV